MKYSIQLGVGESWVTIQKGKTISYCEGFADATDKPVRIVEDKSGKVAYTNKDTGKEFVPSGPAIVMDIGLAELMLSLIWNTTQMSTFSVSSELPDILFIEPIERILETWPDEFKSYKATLTEMKLVADLKKEKVDVE